MFLELSKIAKKYFSIDGTKILYFPTVAGGGGRGRGRVVVVGYCDVKVVSSTVYGSKQYTFKKCQIKQKC
jgi:hypothetical protein